jgi:hypothetical protein
MEKQLISFNGKKLNWDDDIDLIPLGDSRYRLDIVYPNGDNNVVENRREFVSRTINLPIGFNTPVGYCDDIENNAKIIAFYNSSNLHSIIRIYNYSTSYDNLSFSRTEWNFKEYYQVEMGIIGTGDDSFLIMNDNYNPTRCVNIKNLIDGNYPLLSSCDVNLLRPNPLPNFYCFKENISTAKYNYISGKRFQFAYNHIFKDGLETAISHWSHSIFDYGDEYINSELDTNYRYGGTTIPFFDPKVNQIFLRLNGNSSVSKIKIYVKITDIGNGVSGEWGLYDTIDASTYTWGTYITYVFENTKQCQYVDQSVFNYLQYDIPFKSGTMNIINGDRILLGNNDSKYSNIDLDINLTCSSNNITDSLTTLISQSVMTTQGASTLDIKGVYITWQTKLQYIVVITKKINGIFSSKEVYSYQYDTPYTSGYLVNEPGNIIKYINNTNIVSFFVNEINSKTKYNINTHVYASGHPNSIYITNSDYTTCEITATCISSPIVVKISTCKENSSINLGICYYDNNGTPFKVHPLPPVNIPANGNILSNTAGYFRNDILYQINNLPPSDAAYYQFMYAGNNILEHFTIPLLFTDYLGYTSDLEYTQAETLINIDQAISRCYNSNEIININNFEIKKGDRLRIKGYMLTAITIINISEYIDLEIIGLDIDGKLIIPSLSSFNENKNIPTHRIYIVEFYRKKTVTNSTDLVYYEIGDVIPITGGYHEATSKGTGIAINQTSSVPAQGIINFEDAYIFPYYFTDIGIPIIVPVESKSSSFGYDSKLLSPQIDATSGRFNICDDKQIRKIDQSLIYGGVLKQGDLNYNEINKFINSPVYLDSKYGNIIGIVQVGKTLQVYQETKISSIYLNAVETTLADGSTQMNYSDKILGTINYLPYSIGCSHKGGITNNLYSTYFFDLKTSAWYKFSQDGLKDITSLAKMKNYGIYLSTIISNSIEADNTIKIVSGYDPVKDLYLFTYKNYTDPTKNVTMGFHEPTNSWLSWYSFYPDIYYNFNNNIFYHAEKTSSVMELKRHHENSIRVLTGVIQIHFNYSPTDVKTFDYIELLADQIWSPTENNDITVDDNSVAYQNPISKEWSYGKMSSLLKESHFKEREGKFFATFLRNMLNKKGILGGIIYLINGEVLKGNTISIKLRNIKTTVNSLKAIIIGYRKSL